MDKKTSKTLIGNIVSILNIGKDEFGFDGFFYSEEVSHSVTIEMINIFIISNPSCTSFEVYNHFLHPVIALNPTKNMTIRSIYGTLANACDNVKLKKQYYAKSFEHYILSRRDGHQNRECSTKFYVILQTTESCCEHCSRYNDVEAHELDKFFVEFPYLTHQCIYESSCRAAISVMKQSTFENRLKRRREI